MRLNTLKQQASTTLRDMQVRRGDAIFAGCENGVRVVMRFVGTGFLLAWLADGQVQEKLMTNEADAIRIAGFLQVHGCLPWRPRTSRTLVNLRAV
jgi:hypothetical protein